MNVILSSIILIVIICILGFVWWIVGGTHLDYVESQSPVRLKELGFEDCVKEGYERSIIGGFGGRIWWLCKKDNIYYNFGFARRINNPELQLYKFTQQTIFPSSFGIKNLKEVVPD